MISSFPTYPVITSAKLEAVRSLALHKVIREPCVNLIHPQALSVVITKQISFDKDHIGKVVELSDGFLMSLWSKRAIYPCSIDL